MSAKKTTDKTYELKYTGWLTEGESPIYLHYGTENWTEVSENKMRKLKNCYKTEITVPSTVASISFCFRDSNGNWDNNSGNDYWYTPAIGETYSCVEIAISNKVEKAATATKSAAKSATKTCATRKKAVKKEE